MLKRNSNIDFRLEDPTHILTRVVRCLDHGHHFTYKELVRSLSLEYSLEKAEAEQLPEWVGLLVRYEYLRTYLLPKRHPWRRHGCGKSYYRVLYLHPDLLVKPRRSYPRIIRRLRLGDKGFRRQAPESSLSLVGSHV